MLGPWSSSMAIIVARLMPGLSFVLRGDPDGRRIGAGDGLTEAWAREVGRAQLSAKLSAKTMNSQGYRGTAVNDALNHCALQRTVLTRCEQSARELRNRRLGGFESLRARHITPLQRRWRSGALASRTTVCKRFANTTLTWLGSNSGGEEGRESYPRAVQGNRSRALVLPSSGSHRVRYMAIHFPLWPRPSGLGAPVCGKEPGERLRRARTALPAGCLDQQQMLTARRRQKRLRWS